MARRRAAANQRKIGRLAWGGFWLGFALDGILLHQVLQWHHLLAGVAPTGTVGDLRFQILADGLFHVSHYVGPEARPSTLYRHGALMVANGPVAVGCLSWMEA